jgi:hypothetical protein
MLRGEVPRGECPHDQREATPPDQTRHDQVNGLLSRLDEQQRRWYAASASHCIGHGGDPLVAPITGLDPQTSQRGRRALAASLIVSTESSMKTPAGITSPP